MSLTKDWPHGYEIVHDGFVAPARVVCWDAEGDCQIVALYRGTPTEKYPRGAENFMWFKSDGTQPHRAFSGHTLRNTQAPKASGEVWVNIWRHKDGNLTGGSAYLTRLESIMRSNPAAERVAIKRVLWTEGDEE